MKHPHDVSEKKSTAVRKEPTNLEPVHYIFQEDISSADYYSYRIIKG